MGKRKKLKEVLTYADSVKIISFKLKKIQQRRHTSHGGFYRQKFTESLLEIYFPALFKRLPVKEQN